MFDRLKARAKHAPTEPVVTKPSIPQTRIILSPATTFIGHSDHIVIDGSKEEWKAVVSNAMANFHMIDIGQESVNPFHIIKVLDDTQ